MLGVRVDSGPFLSFSSPSLGFLGFFLLERGVEETMKEAFKEEDKDKGVESHDNKRVRNYHS